MRPSKREHRPGPALGRRRPARPPEFFTAQQVLQRVAACLEQQQEDEERLQLCAA